MRSQILSLGLAAALSLTAAANATPLPSDPNLLSGLANIPGDSDSSTVLNNPNYQRDNATDGLVGGDLKDFVFNNGDTDQRLAITGFNSAISTIRIWSTDLRPLVVTIKSSTTSQVSLNAVDYSPLVPLTTPLQPLWVGPPTPGVPTFNPTYIEFSVNAPAGTKSLFFDFGSDNDTCCSPGFTRIGEVQAFVPEPATLSLASTGLGATGLLALARRRRNS